MISSPIRKSRWRNAWLWLGVFLALAAVLGLSRTPNVPPVAPATAADAMAVRNLFERARDLADADKPAPFAMSWSELNAATALGGPALSLPNVRIERVDQTLVLETSKPLLAGFWLNVSTMAERGEDGAPVLRARIGDIPVPSPLMRTVIWVARMGLRFRGVNLPPPADIVQDLKISATDVSALVKLPRQSALINAVSEFGQAPVDLASVNQHYCRLVVLEHKQPSDDFAVHVRRVFAGGNDDDRARLVALAMLTVSPRVGQLAAMPASGPSGCAPITPAAKLNDRLDLAKHWALSSALSASLGADASLAMGVWKEMSDSSTGGSGFSYADLAADRAGILIAERLADPRYAAATRTWLAGVTQDKLLPIEKLALAEGMSEADFVARFEAIDSARDKAVVARIDAAIKAALP